MRIDSSLRARIAAGELLVGSLVNLGSPLTAEIMGLAGFDWLIVDLEHGAGDETVLVGQLQATAARGVPTLVRIESIDGPRFSHVLDKGAAGVLVPRIRSVEDARECVALCRYADKRGIGRFNRSWDWGLDQRSLEEVDSEVVCALQIETREALEEVESIAAVDGVDVLLVGPVDLSHALGIDGDVDHPVLLESAGRVAAAAKAHGKAAGVLVGDMPALEPYRALGFSFLGVSADSRLLAVAARDLVRSLRAPLASPPETKPEHSQREDGATPPTSTDVVDRASDDAG